MIIPVGLSLSEEADIFLKEVDPNIPNINLPIQNTVVTLSDACVKLLQRYFLNIRSTTNSIPMKFSLSLLSKLSEISALNRDKLEADQEDAEFAIMIHTKILEQTSEIQSSHYCHDNINNYDILNQIMSPSVSFDYSREEFGHVKRGTI